MRKESPFLGLRSGIITINQINARPLVNSVVLKIRLCVEKSTGRTKESDFWDQS